ncbi:hypothetical protein BDP27DRAFT_1435303 [Rhodocollybia butyracea]|uniref:Uncharacterized protein n=1 Tax=Rhodocollybia butyracea TaxID=206335 RepID=A0A9P5P5B9_9AGAR|nr:hypothetical protein BDP27DRAFT_1435303 [Rhodocollybia butyracea]
MTPNYTGRSYCHDGWSMDLHEGNIVLEIDEKTGVETGVVTLIDWENYVISGQYGFTEDAEDIQKKLRRSWLPG